MMGINSRNTSLPCYLGNKGGIPLSQQSVHSWESLHEAFSHLTTSNISSHEDKGTHSGIEEGLSFVGSRAYVFVFH